MPLSCFKISMGWAVGEGLPHAPSLQDHFLSHNPTPQPVRVVLMQIVASSPGVQLYSICVQATAFVCYSEK